MSKEIQYIITTLDNTLEGNPWFGRSVYTILEEIDPSIVYKTPNENSHSIAELLYHMIVWAEFTLKRLEKDQQYDEEYYNQNDWQHIDPSIHTWQKGIARFKEVHQQVKALLQTKEDDLLKQKVDFREYNFRFLLHGFIQHNIYHLGQIAYVKKLLG